MSENQIIEKAGVLENLFLYNGTFKRLDYLIYGIAIPLTFIIGGIFLPALLNGQFFSTGIGIALIILALPIIIAATAKRAKDRKENPILTVIGAFIPYIGFIVMLYLLLAPSKNQSYAPKQYGFKHLIIGFGIFITAIFTIVTISKMM